MLAKLKWLVLMPLILTPPYALTNRLHFFPAHDIPRLTFDNAIPFMPQLSWLYLALFPFMWWAVVQQHSVLDAKRFVIGGAAIAWIVSVFFLIFPTTFVRTNTDYEGMYSWILLLDTHYNACPSLHGAYAVYAGASIFHAVRTKKIQLLAIIMMTLIFYATLAVRQHGIVDLGAGGIVGLIAYFCSQRLFRSDTPCKA
jgi:hypothetical protein